MRSTQVGCQVERDVSLILCCRSGEIRHGMLCIPVGVGTRNKLPAALVPRAAATGTSHFASRMATDDACDGCNGTWN